MYGYPRAKASIIKARALAPSRRHSRSTSTSNETDSSKPNEANASPEFENPSSLPVSGIASLEEAAPPVAGCIGEVTESNYTVSLKDGIALQYASVSVGEAASSVGVTKARDEKQPNPSTAARAVAAPPAPISTPRKQPDSSKESEKAESDINFSPAVHYVRRESAKASLAKTLAARRDILSLRNTSALGRATATKNDGSVASSSVSLPTKLEQVTNPATPESFGNKKIGKSSDAATIAIPSSTLAGASSNKREATESPFRKIQTLLSSVPKTPAITRTSDSTSRKTTVTSNTTSQRLSTNQRQKSEPNEPKQQEKNVNDENKHVPGNVSSIKPKRAANTVKFISPVRTDVISEEMSRISFAETPKIENILQRSATASTTSAYMDAAMDSPPPSPTSSSLGATEDSSEASGECISQYDAISTEVDVTCISYDSYIQVQTSAHQSANTIACFIMTSSSEDTNVAPTADTSTTKRTAIKYEANAHEPSNLATAYKIHDSSLLIVHVKTLTPMRDSISPRNVSTSKYEAMNSVRVVRYGDIVALHSPMARNRALGVRQIEKVAGRDSSTAFGSTDLYELGFYRSVLGDKEKWLVLSGLSNDTIRIGSKVRDLESILYNESTLCSLGCPVRSNGDPVTLLNIATGGVLALSHSFGENVSHGALAVITKGEGLQNTFSSGAYESWILKNVNAPSCPRWNGRRMFLSGRYLLLPDRHAADADDEPVLGMRIQMQGKSSNYDRCFGESHVHLQEKVLLKELLGAMMGMEGRFFKFKPRCDPVAIEENDPASSSSNAFSAHEFILCLPNRSEAQIDPSLRHLVQQILPLCTDFVAVNEFVSSRMPKFEYGLVAQAMASAISTLIQEYLIFACQMEQLDFQSKLTISKLWCSVQPSVATLRILSRISEAARDLKGGHLLTRVSELAACELDGDDRAREIVKFVLEQASKPYMDMLHLWLSKGEVYDPFDEFMVENKFPFQMRLSALHPAGKGALAKLNSSLWDDCFGLRRQNIYMITDAVAEKVLTTGKYLNVIRECSAVDASNKEDQTWEIDGARGSVVLTEKIYTSFDSAASIVLNLILTDYHFVDSLRSVKKYFLIDQGDFFVHFLDLAEKELLSPVTKISKARIQSLLIMSIQLSSNNADGTGMDSSGKRDHNKTTLLDDLVCEFARDHLIDRLDSIHKKSGGIVGGQEPKTPSRSAYGVPISHRDGELKGIEALTLECKIDWPLSLILSRQVMELYKLLFRHLFFCKYVERRLFATWLDHQMLKELCLRAYLGKTYCLRQRMLHLMQNLVYYMMFEVIEPHWHKLKEGIANVKTVDDLAKIHNDFQASISQECLLTNTALLRILAKLMTTCLSFADQMRLFMRKTGIEEEFASAATEYRLNRWSAHMRQIKSTSRARKVQVQRSTRLSLQTERLKHELNSEAYKAMIDALWIDFESSLSMFMDQLMIDSSAQSHSHVANLATRLDYNNFISSSSFGK